jgi:phosphoribosyl-AMP cyclohydrolase
MHVVLYKCTHFRVTRRTGPQPIGPIIAIRETMIRINVGEFPTHTSSVIRGFLTSLVPRLGERVGPLCLDVAVSDELLVFRVPPFERSPDRREDKTYVLDSPRGGMSVDAPVLSFDEQPLLPAIAQDAGSGRVLMVAYVTEEALERTRETGLAHYYSRSREALWQKGETSGHTQQIEEIRVDCDSDAVLYLVEQEGGACHTGYESCFYRSIDGETVGNRVFDPSDVYE